LKKRNTSARSFVARVSHSLNTFSPETKTLLSLSLSLCLEEEEERKKKGA